MLQSLPVKLAGDYLVVDGTLQHDQSLEVRWQMAASLKLLSLRNQGMKGPVLKDLLRQLIPAYIQHGTNGCRYR